MGNQRGHGRHAESAARPKVPKSSAHWLAGGKNLFQNGTG